MAIFRQYIAPFLILLVFLVALVAVAARSFLPNDMAAPAPVEEVTPQTSSAPIQTLSSLHADAGLQNSSAYQLHLRASVN
ncbi:hypothetical protein [Microcoleus sp. FACHB-672]|uniref:hypothetical protein n=1 Tax=Microcoleus sp. FACHB-672 TaxID=2692825 RepID=UPI0016896FAD|nr:hypothetical protein [Microcoleus sp. FACHB-672]MBD2043585.1 hypothetical protein [Microcoleus sp. FACHB-672]